MKRTASVAWQGRSEKRQQDGLYRARCAGADVIKKYVLFYEAKKRQAKQ